MNFHEGRACTIDLQSRTGEILYRTFKNTISCSGLDFILITQTRGPGPGEYGPKDATRLCIDLNWILALFIRLSLHGAAKNLTREGRGHIDRL